MEPRSPIGREKRRRVSLRIRTFAHAVQPLPLTKGFEGDSAALLGDDGREEEEEEERCGVVLLV